MYVYLLSEKGYDENAGDWYLYTVGFYDPSGKFQSESDHSTKDEAAARVHYLNGGIGGIVTETITMTAEAEIETTETDEDEDEYDKLSDCAECLCNTCANIEKCVDAPAEHDYTGGKPYPCAECEDSAIYHMRGGTCKGYVEGSGNYV